jgi:hypothetical protein
MLYWCARRRAEGGSAFAAHGLFTMSAGMSSPRGDTGTPVPVDADFHRGDAPGGVDGMTVPLLTHPLPVANSNDAEQQACSKDWKYHGYSPLRRWRWPPCPPSSSAP